MLLETLRKIIVDFQNRELPKLIKRGLRVTFIKDMSISIIGARRSGKTYRTYQLIQELIQKGISKENFCRIQFNDHRLKFLSIKELHLIDESYYSLYPEKRGNEVVCFIFDEIHRIDGWEDFILYLLENSKHKVIITGSTSKLLKGRVSSSLRGKNLPVILYPFSFIEFLKYFKIKPDMLSSKGQSYLKKALQRYLNQGGFPGLLEIEDDGLQIELLQTYWDTMILRDIIEAHPEDRINIVTFTNFVQALVSRTSCPFTIRKIIVNLEKMNLKFTPETIYKYLKYLEEAFMIYAVPIYTKSEKIKNRNYQKLYVLDWGLADAIAPADGIDVTRKFENMIFIELLRRSYEVYYYITEKGYEIDFLARKRGAIKSKLELYQVCYDFSNEDVKERELRGIYETAKYLKISSCKIITYDNEEKIKIKGYNIDVVPAWKWLLEECNKYNL